MKYLIINQETSDILKTTKNLDKAHRLASFYHNMKKFNGNNLVIQICENKAGTDNAIAEYSDGEFSFNMR